MLVNIASGKSNSTLSDISTDQVQPNAVDLRVSRIWRFKDTLTNHVELSEDGKKHAEKVEIHADDFDDYWNLPVGSYEVQFEGVIKVGADEAGWVITRSTLNRNGVFITSGLYDSGYEGAMAACMHVAQVPLRLKKNTRVGQYVAVKAESVKLYDGDYGIKADGTVKDAEKRYHE